MNEWFEAEQRVERAQQLTESHRFAEALAELDAALAINPHNAAWHAQRGFLLDELGEPDQAVEAYQHSLSIEPDDREVMLALGHALLNMGRYARAANLLQDLIRKQPEFESAYCPLIGAYCELGQHEKAEEVFYLAQERDDSCPNCFFYIGVSLATRGQLDRALYCWRRVLELDPTYVGVNRHIAEAHRRRGDLEKAREYLLNELRGDAGNTDLLCELGELALQAGDVAAAASKFSQVLELDPEHISAKYAQGRILLATGKVEEAIKCFEQVEEIADIEEEDLLDYHLKFGEALLLQNRLPEARRRLEKALAEGDPSDDLFMIMGNCLLSDGKPNEAAEYFRRLIARDAKNSFAHHHLGLAMMRMGRYEAGLQHCLAAIENRPDFAVAMYNAAIGYTLLGRWKEAKSMLQRAVKQDPTNELIGRTLRRLWRLRMLYYARRCSAFFRWAVGRS